MHGVLTHASLARIPASALVLLGRLRAYASVQVRVEDQRAWVRWDEAGFQVLRALLPVEGAKFYEKLDSSWRLCGHSLPAFEIPEDGFVPLATVLTPAPVYAEPDEAEAVHKVLFALKRAAAVQPARAMLCKPGVLGTWADMATLAEFSGLEAARSGDLVLVTATGDANLPPLAGAERYWGERRRGPLGHRPDPDRPESGLLAALGVGDDEFALVRHAAVEVIPRGVLQPLTRASARLGAGA